MHVRYRYGLVHEVPAVMEAIAAKGSPERPEGPSGKGVAQSSALQLWLSTLEMGLPRSHDGGAAVAAVGELLAGVRRNVMMGKVGWNKLLGQTGVGEWPDKFDMCSSARSELHGSCASLERQLRPPST